MKDFLKLVRIEFKRIFSNNVLLAIFIGAPIFYGVLFGYVYKQSKVLNLSIVVVDEDQSPMSDKVIQAFEDNEVLSVNDIRYTPGNLLKEMPVKQYDAVITFPKNFEADILQKRHPEIRVDLNMANILNANTASKNIQAVLITLNAGIEIESLKKSGLNEKQAKTSYESFKINFNKLYNSSGNYTNFMFPGLMIAIIQQVIFLAMALVFARDFEDGHFEFILKKNKSALYLVLLKSTPFLIMIPFIWVFVCYLFSYFNIDLDIFNFPMFLLAAILTMASMSIGMLFSIAIPSQLKATELLMVISTPAFILSGFTWPTIAFPEVIADFAQIIPSTQFLNGLRRIVFYGGDVASIQPEINKLLIIFIVSFSVLVILLQLKINKYRKKETHQL